MGIKACRNLKASLLISVFVIALVSVFSFCPRAFADTDALAAGALPSNENAAQAITTQSKTTSLGSSKVKTVTGTFVDGAFKKTIRATAQYANSYFAKRSTARQAGLAKLSMLASATAYGKINKGYSSYSKRLLKQCGFTASYKRLNPTGADNDRVSYAIGHKKVGKSTVVAVWVKGTSPDYEWISNLHLGADKTHEGFSLSKTKMKTSVDRYIKNKKIKGPIKWWITGHSRGAAVANLYAKDLTDKYGKRNVYAYTFASPRVSQSAKKTGYENIFNYLNPGDIVTEIPPAKWGYKRFGVDITFASKSKKSMASKFKKVTGAKYQGFTNAGKKSFLKSFLAIADYFRQSSVESQGEYSESGGLSIAAADVNVNALLGNVLLGGSLDRIAHAHCQASYICWLDAMYPNSGA